MGVPADEADIDSAATTREWFDPEFDRAAVSGWWCYEWSAVGINDGCAVGSSLRGFGAFVCRGLGFIPLALGHDLTVTGPEPETVLTDLSFNSNLQAPPLLLALVPLALFGVAVQRRIRSWWLLIPLALLTRGLVHASSIHATVAAVLLAFAVPVCAPIEPGPDAGPGMAEHFVEITVPRTASPPVTPVRQISDYLARTCTDRA